MSTHIKRLQVKVQVLLSVGSSSIQNPSKKVAQAYSEKGDGEGFLVLIYRANIYLLRCNLS